MKATPEAFGHWTSAVRRGVKFRRLTNYPRKLRAVVGDPRTRVGTFFDDLATLAARWDGSRNLTAYEFRVFSQNGEDGVIAEIVRRIGDDCPQTFVEFGAGSGRFGNCVFLADVLGWAGLFIEPASVDFAALQSKYGYSSRVRTSAEFVTPTTINQLVEAAALGDIGIMSIDIDGNDYYVWEALTSRPAVIVIEYNGSIPLDEHAVQPFSRDPWDGTNFFGASLRSMIDLALSKGYVLVHTELSGANAFFVDEKFASLFTDLGEVPWRGANYELLGFRHPPDDQGRSYLRLPERHV